MCRNRAIDKCGLRHMSVIDQSTESVKLATVVDVVDVMNACGTDKGQYNL